MHFRKRTMGILLAGLLGAAAGMSACGSAGGSAATASQSTAASAAETESMAAASAAADSTAASLSAADSAAASASAAESVSAASAAAGSAAASASTAEGASTEESSSAEAVSATSGSETDSSSAADAGAVSSSAEPIQIKSASQAEENAAADSYPASPAWVTALPNAQDETVSQLVIVAGTAMDASTATVSMHVRGTDGTWREVLSTSGIMGRDGMCPDEEHREGSDFTLTPIGVYRFNKAFGLAEDPGCSIAYTQVDGDDYWSGDEREGMAYNQMVDIKEYPDLDLESSVHFTGAEEEYQYCLNISFNEEGTPGRGSAIFLRCAGKAEATGGSVAIPEESLKTIMEIVKPECVVIMDTAAALGADGTAAADASGQTAEEAGASEQASSAASQTAAGGEAGEEEVAVG